MQERNFYAAARLLAIEELTYGNAARSFEATALLGGRRSLVAPRLLGQEARNDYAEADVGSPNSCGRVIRSAFVSSLLALNPIKNPGCRTQIPPASDFARVHVVFNNEAARRARRLMPV
jgi:hypothetical protein